MKNCMIEGFLCAIKLETHATSEEIFKKINGYTISKNIGGACLLRTHLIMSFVKILYIFIKK